MNARTPPCNEVLLEVRIWGDFACFTRPEMKVERVTYPVPTPSAMRGVLEAIFWKPEITWHIQEIWVLKPIHYFSILRNEVTDKQSERAAKSWAKKGGGYNASANRAQRNTLALRDVDYLVRAQVQVKSGVDAHPAKYRDQFRRRVAQGRCFNQPYLGCREFSAYFAPPQGNEMPVDLNDDLGRMLLDIDYSASTGTGKSRNIPQFFQAKLESGVLRVPDSAQLATETEA